MKRLTIKNLLFDEVLEQNTQRLNEVAKYIKQGQSTLVAGAGLSVPAGLPGWNALLAKAFSVIIDLSEPVSGSTYFIGFQSFRETHSERFKELVEQFARGDIMPPGDTNFLEAGEYIEQALNQIALPGYDTLSSRISRVRLQAVLRQCMKPNKTIEELSTTALWKFAELIISYIKSGKGIGNVITYNYDNLLECCLMSCFRNTYDKDDRLENHCIIHVDRDMEAPSLPPTHEHMAHIYHVHGSFLLPGLEDYGKNSDNLILSEESYYEVEKQAYNWVHLVQAQALLNSSCIFSGFSAEDYNFRRLIKSLNPSRLPYKHYILFTINDAVRHFYHELTGAEPPDFDEKDKAREDICFLINYYLSLKENYWRRYNIYPIWSTYDDLPDQVKSLITPM